MGTEPGTSKGQAPTLTFRRAREDDAATLAEVSARAFRNDVTCGAPRPGGPAGYDSPAWQAQMMRRAQYYAMLLGERIVGGLIVFARGPGHYHLGRIFIDADLQNQGLGTQAMAFLWRTYPLATRWTLDTPAWNRRTRHFYQKVGFREVGQDAQGGVHFERRSGPARRR